MRRGYACAAALSWALIISSCQPERPEGFLGSATVESTTLQLASSVRGPLVRVNKREGERIAPDELCALIDTTDLALHMRELEAGLAELSSTIAAKSAEIEALEAEVRGVAREYGRIGELAEKGSVPAQRKDDLGTKLQAANLKLKAARHMRTSLVQRKRGLNVKQSMVRKQLDDCYLRAPSAGIVITRYKNAGELAAPGTAVLEIGHFDTMYVDFFVPQPLMSQLSYGQNVRIRVDSGDGAIFLPAIITWLSDEAEFTPQNVQTRESRNELVFRVRARAANAGGVLKRGMPVEVWREAAS